ncbi:unnamed protein product [Ilex paraguariensis]|uniref:Secreted protein n=1 Tax=Ilex paraguariensis TaxID=185542 RepID=A0ABC8TX62_9AQUA
MREKMKLTVSFWVVLYHLVLCATLQSCSSASNPPQRIKKQSKSTATEDRFGSSVVFPVSENVYPKGYMSFYLWVFFRFGRCDLDGFSLICGYMSFYLYCFGV